MQQHRFCTSVTLEKNPPASEAAAYLSSYYQVIAQTRQLRRVSSLYALDLVEYRTFRTDNLYERLARANVLQYYAAG